MRRARAWLSLAERAAILAVLILRAAWLYLRTVLHHRGTWRSDPERLTRSYVRFGASFVAVAVRFRGGLIKLGQLGSLRSEVIPEEVTRELARLQDRVPPHPFAEIAAQIESELGAPLEQRFAWFESAPLAAASLGQVHRARDREGSELAVKVLYPGVERSVAVDLAMTHLGLWLFDFVAVADLMRIYREIRASLLGEMDYVREGRAAERIAHNLAGDPALFAKLRLPAIHWKTTTRRVLSMEYIEGTKITDHEALVARGIDPEQAVVTATRAFLHMIFRDGFFHCDPHPGNLLVDLDGRVAIVDFGMNKQIEPEVLAAIRKNVRAAVTRDHDLWAQSLVDAGMIGADQLAVAQELAKLNFDPRYYNLTPQEMMQIDFGDYFARMRTQMKRIKSFQLPDGLVMWSRAFSLLYGLNAELAPGVRPLEVIGPYVLEFLSGGAQSVRR